METISRIKADIKADIKVDIEADQRNGNLHLHLVGQFIMEAARRLTMTMARNYRGGGNIFIHTESITKVTPDLRQAFGDLVGMAVLPSENICMIGSRCKKLPLP